MVTNEKNKALKNIGLVTTSTWVDIDGDMWDDLVVTGEWMPIYFFKNNKGNSFSEITSEVFKSESEDGGMTLKKVILTMTEIWILLLEI